MSSLRISNSEWISDSLIIGETGLGVLAENIPSTGTNGGSFLYDDLTFPDDQGKEIRAVILTYPTDGILKVYEDGSFIFSDAPDGVYTFTYGLDVMGVRVGSPATVTMNVGLDGMYATVSSSVTVTSGLTTGIPLRSDTFSVSTSSASLLTAIQLSASAYASASLLSELETGEAQTLFAALDISSAVLSELTSQVLMSAFVAARATGTATLTTSGSASPIGIGDKLVITFIPSPYTISLL